MINGTKNLISEMINYKKITVSYVYNPTVDEIFNALANKKVSHSTRHKKTFTNIKEAEIYEKNIVLHIKSKK